MSPQLKGILYYLAAVIAGALVSYASLAIVGEQWGPEYAAGIAGAAISLLAQLIPGFKDWFDNLGAQNEALVMLAVLAGVVGLVFGAGCFWLLATAIFVCSAAGAGQALLFLISLIIGNQVSFLAVKPILIGKK